MLASVQAATHTLSGREVVIAIAGGTMLTLALTRPRLRWMEALTKDSDSAHAWAERTLTLFLLVMAAYAGCTLVEVLSHQLGRESVALLRGAGAFLLVYAWLVHFEPFVKEWRLRGGVGAAVLYTCVMYAALVVGFLLTGVALKGPFPVGQPGLIFDAVAVLAMGLAFYQLLPRLQPAGPASSQANVPAGRGADPEDEATATAQAERSAPTRTPARSSRA